MQWAENSAVVMVASTVVTSADLWADLMDDSTAEKWAACWGRCSAENLVVHSVAARVVDLAERTVGPTADSKAAQMGSRWAASSV